MNTAKLVSEAETVDAGRGPHLETETDETGDREVVAEITEAGAGAEAEAANEDAEAEAENIRVRLEGPQAAAGLLCAEHLSAGVSMPSQHGDTQH